MTRTKKPKKSFNIRNFPEELKKDFRIWCLENDMTLKAGVIKAIKKLMNGKQHADN